MIFIEMSRTNLVILGLFFFLCPTSLVVVDHRFSLVDAVTIVGLHAAAEVATPIHERFPDQPHGRPLGIKPAVQFFDAVSHDVKECDEIYKNVKPSLAC